MLPGAEVRTRGRHRNRQIRHPDLALAERGKVFDDPSVGPRHEVVRTELHERLVRIERALVTTPDATRSASDERAVVALEHDDGIDRVRGFEEGNDTAEIDHVGVARAAAGEVPVDGRDVGIAAQVRRVRSHSLGASTADVAREVGERPFELV